MMERKKLLSIIRNIRCIAYDFDGVMTDNRVLLSEDGIESVFVNRGDGYAVSKLKELGYEQIIVSTETNVVVSKRAQKLHLEVVQGTSDKTAVIKKYCNKKRISLSEVMYIGNDYNDLSAFSIVGLTGAPKDAEEEILKRADWISERCGGYGVIRDLYEIIYSDEQMEEEK